MNFQTILMNPSASGWIDKYFARLKHKLPLNASEGEFYKALREKGFVYGHVLRPGGVDTSVSKGWTTEEVTKTALLDALYEAFRLQTQTEDPKEFVNKALDFYHQMVPEGFNILKKVLPASPPAHELEDILDERVQTNDNIISRNFSHILTNALLFMDVLAFLQFLHHEELPAKYLKKLEETVVSAVTLALQSKARKTEYDNLLIKLFESSVRYTKFSNVQEGDLDKLELGYFTSIAERSYLLDMAGMAIWSDGAAESAELDFLYGLAHQLHIGDEEAAESIATFDVFIKLNKKNISYFKYSNPVKHFYDHAAQTVTLLINRNRNRLVKELGNNGELMLLLTHSTHRSLDASEKKKIRKQLLEICKTIPSLTIFLLPGGSLLLPLLIKFIPQLLPSVFNENLEEDNT